MSKKEEEEGKNRGEGRKKKGRFLGGKKGRFLGMNGRTKAALSKLKLADLCNQSWKALEGDPA